MSRGENGAFSKERSSTESNVTFTSIQTYQKGRPFYTESKSSYYESTKRHSLSRTNCFFACTHVFYAYQTYFLETMDRHASPPRLVSHPPSMCVFLAPRPRRQAFQSPLPMIRICTPEEPRPKSLATKVASIRVDDSTFPSPGKSARRRSSRRRSCTPHPIDDA